MGNQGNFIGSLGGILSLLDARAEALGVEIHPGFAAIELLYGGNGEVVGIATRDMGIARNGRPKAGFKRGMEPIRQIVLLAEGVRGSLSRQEVSRYRLDSASGPLHLNYKTRHFPHSISFSLSRSICWCVGPLLVPNG